MNDDIEFTWDLDTLHDLACPQCGYEFQKTWRELHAEDKFVCGNCGREYLAEAVRTLRQRLIEDLESV